MQRETGSRPIAEHALWGESRWGNISESRPARLGLRRGLRFFPGVSSRAFLLINLRTENVWLFNILFNILKWTTLYREYKIYSSQIFSSNHSQHSQTGCSCPWATRISNLTCPPKILVAQQIFDEQLQQIMSVFCGYRVAWCPVDNWCVARHVPGARTTNFRNSQFSIHLCRPLLKLKRFWQLPTLKLRWKTNFKTTETPLLSIMSFDSKTFIYLNARKTELLWNLIRYHKRLKRDQIKGI
jgi:hypothetical protein